MFCLYSNTELLLLTTTFFSEVEGNLQVRPPGSMKGLSPAFKDTVFQFGVFYYSSISLAGTTWLLSTSKYKKGIPRS